MAVGLSYIAAFGGGVISFASPCVLPLVPAYLSVVTGVDVRQDPGQGATVPMRAAVARTTLLFVAGFGLVFVLLGMTASALGRSIFRDHILIGRITGVVVVAMGVFMLLSTLGRFPAFALAEKRFHPRLSRLGPFAAPVAGVAFGFGWTPCIGPILSAILAISANQRTIGQGGLLLGFYAAGLGVPFLVTGLAYNQLRGSLSFLRRHGNQLSLIAGAALVGFGLLLAFDRFSLVTVALNGFFTRIGLARLIYLG
ncbi:MAG: cytochrome c biogenesis protein CcdA [Actinomycetota bacterium]|nr:cytochrome c biogenesis protein CcdA [Actinomycetota bacterium]